MKKAVSWIVISLLMGGCSEKMQNSLMPMMDSIVPQRVISSEDRKSIIKIGNSMVKSVEDLTPEQEYYIGRTVSSNIFNRYKTYDNPKLHEYVSLIGNQLAFHSSMPSTFGGYHFQILDSDEINAFAAPGGFIFITRGMLKCAHNEDELGAIIAHEIGHVVNRHGLRSIKSSRWSDLGSTLVISAAKHYSKNEVKNLVSTFEGSIGDIMNTMTVNGYSKEYEYEADSTALTILVQSGYNPDALSTMLTVMKEKVKGGDKGFGSTHPLPEDRIRNARKITYDTLPISQVRNKRFQSNVKYF